MPAEEEPSGRTAAPGQPDDRGEAEARGAGTGDERFIEDLVVRGEVVPAGTEPLPPGATHEVVAEQDGVPSQVRRRRFSAHG
jgi:hypothetical protein